jgi:hypothetical protein
MGDLLAQRCASMKDLVLELMQLGIKVQTDPALLDDVSRLLERIRSVVALGADGVDSDDYARWIAAAEVNLARMDEAVRTGEVTEIWAAFTDKVTGFYLLGNACQGQPGW